VNGWNANAFALCTLSLNESGVGFWSGSFAGSALSVNRPSAPARADAIAAFE
jgi:hypothetical protein